MSDLHLMPPADPHACQACGRRHDPAQPHDAASLQYQYDHYFKTGRWPDWRDAMAHCDAKTQAIWKQALIEAGIEVDKGGVLPGEVDDETV